MTSTSTSGNKRKRVDISKRQRRTTEALLGGEWKNVFLLGRGGGGILVADGAQFEQLYDV
jgi:hypothetical protein